MPDQIDPAHVAEIMLSWLSLSLVSCTKLQSLWAGYGQICAIHARAKDAEAAKKLHEQLKTDAAEGNSFRLVLKFISPPVHIGSVSTDEGHLRKMLSYGVEQYFYDQISPQLADDTAVARCLASTRNMQGKPRAEELKDFTATLMTDLRLEFPISGEGRALLSPRQVISAVDWLANFHAGSWKLLPDTISDYLQPPFEEQSRKQVEPETAGSKLWLNGGYTYLATRQKEYHSLLHDRNSEWSEAFCTPAEDSGRTVAELVADFLTPSGRPFETFIHGDVKSEDLFTTDSEERVAFFDFQYVGLGLGVCDLAKLFTCSVPLSMLSSEHDIKDTLPMNSGEEQLLGRYLSTLFKRRPQDKETLEYDWDVFRRHWETALVDWCRFQASWGFWGNTEWLEARVRSILHDKEWKAWLEEQVRLTK